jgi:hypothetical protein
MLQICDGYFYRVSKENFKSLCNIIRDSRTLSKLANITGNRSLTTTINKHQCEVGTVQDVNEI